MQNREKYLLIGLVAAVVLWQGVPVVRNAFMGPLEQKRAQLQAIELKLKQKQTEEAEVMAATRALGTAKDRSLPPDPLDAQRLYQQWLTDVALLSGFQQLKVSPERRVPKAKTFVGVMVAVEGQATIDQLSRFLFHFYRTDLLHRVVQLHVASPENTGNPLLAVKLTAEGLSLQGAPQRERLFAETRAAAEVAETATMLPVAGAKGFPSKPGFRIRIGSEFLKVTGVGKNQWTVARGVDGTRAAQHAAGAAVELSPTSAAFADRTLDDYRKLVAASPFVKPQKYDPQLAPLGEQIVIRGTPWKLAAKATGFDPALGALAYAVSGELPEGLSIDPQSGELSWNPGDGIPAGRFTGTVTVSTAEAPNVKVAQPLQLTLRERNQPPVVEAVAPQKAFLGGTLTFPVQARDADEPANKLTYRLDGAPQGATVDAATGQVQWTPPLTVSPGDYELTVTVSDDGAPPQSASQKVKVAVADDVAQYTFLIAAIDADDDRQAWLYDRSTNRKLVVREGTTFSIADITAQVLTIGRDFVLLERDAMPWRLDLGENLRGMQRIEGPATTPVSEGVDHEEKRAEAIPAAAAVSE